MARLPHNQDRGVRWAERRTVQIEASIRGHRQIRFNVDVIDLSISGFRFETAFSMHTGTRLWLNVPGFQGLEAEVKWHEGFTYGCAFTVPLHPAVCDHLVRQFPGVL